MLPFSTVLPANDAKAVELAKRVEEYEVKQKLAEEEERRKKEERQEKINKLAQQQGCYYILQDLYKKRADAYQQYAIESLTGFQLYETKESPIINGVVGSKLGGPVLGAAAYASSSIKNDIVDAHNEAARKNNIASEIKVKTYKAEFEELDKKVKNMEEEILKKGGVEE